MHRFKLLKKLSTIFAMNSFSTSITPGEQVSPKREVSIGLVVMIIEGIAREAINRA